MGLLILGSLVGDVLGTFRLILQDVVNLDVDIFNEKEPRVEIYVLEGILILQAAEIRGVGLPLPH